MSRTFDNALAIAVHDTHHAAHAPFSASNFFEKQWRVTADLRITSVIVNARCSGASPNIDRRTMTAGHSRNGRAVPKHRPLILFSFGTQGQAQHTGDA
jgi:hypothetical protein